MLKRDLPYDIYETCITNILVWNFISMFDRILRNDQKHIYCRMFFLWIEFEGSKMHYYKRHTTLNANAMFVLIFNAYTFKQIPNGSSKYTCMGPYRFRNIWFVLPLFATWYNLDRCLSPSHAFHYFLYPVIHQWK